MFEGLTNAVFASIRAVLSVFPNSPFQALYSMSASGDLYQWLKYLNWFVPVSTFVAILELWLAGIAIYYVLQVFLRWLKAIE